MTTSLIRTETDQQRANVLLAQSPPAYREAYSDRTAWIMACLSELVYLRFNPLIPSPWLREKLIDQVEQYADSKYSDKLRALLDIVAYDEEAEKTKLINELSLINMTLVDTFDRNGTQAILVENDHYITLAYRGTEKDSIRDIRADIDAVKEDCATGGQVHRGFSNAFKEIEADVSQALNNERFKDKPLYITGHSLGGAIATIAAKRLQHQAGVAACYTYGSPRVGDVEWVSTLKTPIYRLVNAADSVTMLPPGGGPIDVLSWLVGLIPGAGERWSSLLQNRLGNYMHTGYMRYLTNSIDSHYRDVKLLYSVNLWFRIKGLIVGQLPWKNFVADHSIATYRRKLAKVAADRNQPSDQTDNEA